jgi:hypothetical protein
MAITPEEQQQRRKVMEQLARRYVPTQRVSTNRLIIGDIVRLRDGGPEMLVVDAWPSAVRVTVAYRVMRNGAIEVRESEIERCELVRVRRGR